MLLPSPLENLLVMLVTRTQEINRSFLPLKAKLGAYTGKTREKTERGLPHNGMQPDRDSLRGPGG